MFSISVFFLFLIGHLNLFSQNSGVQDLEYYNKEFLRFENYIYDENIHTVLLNRSDDPLSYPVFQLNSEIPLLLSFDDFNTDLSPYIYSFIHCNPAWEPSDISESEYIEGFNLNYITDYIYSVNTKQAYIHYFSEFPNSNVNFKLSGNYLLKVYKEHDKDRPILTQRFIVIEKSVVITSRIKRASNVGTMNTHQQIDFSVNYGSLKVINPNEDLNISILQNFRWDNSINNLKPRFLQGNELIYDKFDENSFYGGNEFRFFDIKNLRFQTERVAQINTDSSYHIYLLKDDSKVFSRYVSSPDINGKYLIRNQLGTTSDYDSEYAWVYFNLIYPTSIPNGNIYVFGALSNWSFSNKFKMNYEKESKSYKAKIFLKQGYYNYAYSFVKDKTKTGNETIFEGSFYETENDYFILVYYKEPGRNYYRLIGFSSINSVQTF